MFGWGEVGMLGAERDVRPHRKRGQSRHLRTLGHKARYSEVLLEHPARGEEVKLTCCDVEYGDWEESMNECLYEQLHSQLDNPVIPVMWLFQVERVD
jgi:hypothetical protein